MINLYKSLLITISFCTVFYQKTVFGANSKNKFYFEPFFNIDYQIWQSEQSTSVEDDGNYDFKFKGLYWGPRIGGKFLWIYNGWWIYGFEGSYAYLFNKYNPDPGSSDEAKEDDEFLTDSKSSQTQLGLFTGFQYQRFGLKLQYFPLSSIENEAFHSTLNEPNTKNTYAGSGFGVGISYIYRPKINFYFEYQNFEFNNLTIDGNDTELPNTINNVSINVLTTTKYSIGISMIF